MHGNATWGVTAKMEGPSCGSRYRTSPEAAREAETHATRGMTREVTRYVTRGVTRGVNLGLGHLGDVRDAQAHVPRLEQHPEYCRYGEEQCEALQAKSVKRSNVSRAVADSPLAQSRW